MGIIEFLKLSVEGELNVNEQEKFLEEKSELSAEELAEVVRFLEKEMMSGLSMPEAIDVCGTGGSGLERMNTSTIAAFVLAALGVKVAKHGNKAASGRFGSFDLLEGLGINIDLGIGEMSRLYGELGLVFLYARSFHPVMKYFAEVRQRVNKPTFFNIVGPLISPVGVKRQIIGTSSRSRMKLIAETCKLLGKERVMVVCGEDGLDEVTLGGKTEVLELKDGKIEEYVLEPEDFGLEKAEFKLFSGGAPEKNLKIANDIFEALCIKKNCPKKHLELVLVNVALVLRLVGVEEDLKKGYEMAKKAVEVGEVLEIFEKYREMSNVPSVLVEIVEEKRKEITPRGHSSQIQLESELVPYQGVSFYDVIKKKGISLIAEIKKASPSEGVIREDFDVEEIAGVYKKAGVDAVSVLCDQKFFKGSYEDLRKVVNVLKDNSKRSRLGGRDDKGDDVPVLCKEFIIDESQIFLAREHGAAAVLLIGAILSEEKIRRFIEICEKLGMDALCEVHNKNELEKALGAGAKIVGINNRNLDTFEVDLDVTRELLPLVPKEVLVVSESGIKGRDDVESLPVRVDGILVGTCIMKSEDIGGEVEGLRGPRRGFLKICGVRSVEEALFCEKIGVDCIGLNHVRPSKRCLDLETAKEICAAASGIKKVGVFQNQDIEFVNGTAECLDLDFIQLSGDESPEYVQQCVRPVIKGISVKNADDLKKIEDYVDFAVKILIDGPKPGSGKGFDLGLLKGVEYPFIVAGGISLENAGRILEDVGAMGVDVASGVETDGRIDLGKVEKLTTITKQYLIS